MASPALDDFNAWVDAQSVNNATKTAVKNRGATLYDGATREAVAHLRKHVEAEIAQLPEGRRKEIAERALQWFVQISRDGSRAHLALDFTAKLEAEAD